MNLRILLIVLLLNIFSLSLFAQQLLSGKAEISLLTCSPGDELYSLFGHTAIRVLDPVNKMDIVFNYGTFDFNTQGFYFKFARGLLPYQLSISEYRYFKRSYEIEERSIFSQTLNLDSIQKQRLFDLLVENYQPENREYLYSFLFDNCTTRARDIIKKTCNDNIEWISAVPHKSFWNLLDEYLIKSPWIEWGIHTILGAPANRVMTTEEQMFLPDYLMYAVDSAFYRNNPLASEIEVLYNAPEKPIVRPWYFSPFFIFTIGALILGFLIQKYKSVKLLKSIAFVFLIITGLIGCLIVFLGAFTLHPTTAPNWNILWANPINLVIAFAILGSKVKRWVNVYLTIYILVLLVGIILWHFFTPSVLYSTIVIMLWMIYLSWKLKNVYHI